MWHYITITKTGKISVGELLDSDVVINKYRDQEYIAEFKILNKKYAMLCRSDNPDIIDFSTYENTKPYCRLKIVIVAKSLTNLLSQCRKLAYLAHEESSEEVDKAKATIKKHGKEVRYNKKLLEKLEKLNIPA